MGFTDFPYYLGPDVAGLRNPHLRIEVAFSPQIAGEIPEGSGLILDFGDLGERRIPIGGAVYCPDGCYGSECDCCWDYEMYPEEETYLDPEGNPCDSTVS